MTDGLAALNQQRDRRRRSIPPSRTGPRTTPVNVPMPVEDHPAVAAPPAATEPPPSAVPVGASEPFSASEPGDQELVRSSIYFDSSNDAFLELVRAAGRRARPKVDASRSAVARLAVALLEEKFAPAVSGGDPAVRDRARVEGAAQVVAELVRRASAQQTPGGPTAVGRRRL